MNGTDPTGKFSFSELLVVSTVTALVNAVCVSAYIGIKSGSMRELHNSFVENFWRGFFIAGTVYSAIWLIYSFLFWLSIAIIPEGYGSLKYAEKYDICSYRILNDMLRGTNLQAHHIIPQRFAELLGLSQQDMLCIAVDAAEHQMFTNFWRDLIPYGIETLTVTKEQILEAARIIYTDYPIVLKAAEVQIKAAGR